MGTAEDHHNRGVVLRRAGEVAAAEAELLTALSMRPDQPVFHYSLGNLYRFSGRLPEAVGAYRRSLELDPADVDAQMSLGGTLMASGRFTEGWPLFDQRPQRLNSPARQLSFPEWRGEPVEGRSVFIFPEQGLGDQIQCARFARTLLQRGASRVTLACHPSLVRLFERLDVSEVVPHTQTMAVARHDFWTLPFSLARYLAPTIDAVDGAPYLAGEPRPRRGVGLVWRGSSLHPDDRFRSLPARPAIDAIDLTGRTGDFLPTADLISGLERVVTVDTAVAHLAGALGTPCDLLLPALGLDWRWLVGRNQSPWYNSLRLFRQPAPGNWSAVLDQVDQAPTPVM